MKKRGIPGSLLLLASGFFAVSCGEKDIEAPTLGPPPTPSPKVSTFDPELVHKVMGSLKNQPFAFRSLLLEEPVGSPHARIIQNIEAYLLDLRNYVDSKDTSERHLALNLIERGGQLGMFSVATQVQYHIEFYCRETQIPVYSGPDPKGRKEARYHIDCLKNLRDAAISELNRLAAAGEEVPTPYAWCTNGVLMNRVREELLTALSP